MSNSGSNHKTRNKEKQDSTEPRTEPVSDSDDEEEMSCLDEDLHVPIWGNFFKAHLFVNQTNFLAQIV